MKLVLLIFLTLLSYNILASNIDVAFSPGDNAINLVLDAINSAHSSVCVAAYSFTAKPIAQALLAAKARGITVRIVADSKANSRKYALVRFLAKQGIAVHLNSQYAIMHNKFMVIDGQTIETGSFNYSQAAIKNNAENVIVIWNKPRIAAIYEQQCNKLYADGYSLAE